MTFTRRQALASVGAFAAASTLPASGQAQAPARGDGQAEAGSEPVCLTDFEPLAKAKMPPRVWEFLTAGAGDELTLRWNREAYERIRLKPRVLVDVSRLDTRVTLFGQEQAFPILLAPVAAQTLEHPEGELATARGAGAAQATMVLSSFSGTSLEDVSAVAKRPLWFQLYAQTDRGFTRELVQRAEAAGYRALCLTVDTPVTGARNREARAHVELPPLPNLRGMKEATGGVQTGSQQLGGGVLDAALNWKDVEWLRSFAKVPLLLKGVLNPEDADEAVKVGVAGIIVSNHGGRNLDTVPATIDALPHVADKVGGRVPVLVDGGIRRGTDVLKAIALGANAVLIGRPYVFGLAANGEAGVKRVLNILQREFQLAMALTGRTTIASIDRSVIWPFGGSI
ncbi:MAG: alpha-hydroxy acid oxidase [Acidobacteriaceae bacterium]